MSDSIETRYLPGVELRAVAPNKPPLIVGYAAVFNSVSDELPLTEGRTYREVIRPGAFLSSIASRADVLARFEHNELLGRVSNGTLRLVEDQRGLRYEIDPPDTSVGRDVVALIRRRDISASSFAFKVKFGGDTWRREGSTLVREIRAVSLLDVSPVAKPAYPETDVAVRSLAASEANQGSRNHRMAMRLALAERS